MPKPKTSQRSPRSGGSADAGSTGPDLWAVVAPACAAASVGSLAAILGSIRQINPVLVQRIDLVTVLAGLAGAAVGWWLGRSFGRLARGRAGTAEAGEAGTLRRRVTLGLVVLGVALVAGFVIAVVGQPDSRRSDMAGGALLAVLVLSGVGWSLWRLSRIFGRPDDTGEGAP